MEANLIPPAGDLLLSTNCAASRSSRFGVTCRPGLWPRPRDGEGSVRVRLSGVGVDLFCDFWVCDRRKRPSDDRIGERRVLARRARRFAGQANSRGLVCRPGCGRRVAASQVGGFLLGATSADLKAAAGFYGNFHWAPCFASEADCGALTATSHFWSLANEMQFYLAAPFLMALKPKWTALICFVVLAAGALCNRQWGGFWWTFRLDGLAMGVLLSLGMAGPWRLPRIGVAMAMFWLVVASILARILGAVASGFALTSVAMVFGFVVASAVQTKPQTREILRAAKTR